MHVVVCINRIPDPEAPWREVKLDELSATPRLEQLDRVMGPFDENALEVALQLKDSAGARVTVLSLGPASNEDALRRALAVRCDTAIHIREEQAPELDSDGTARLLGAAIRRIGGVDLVLCGRQVGDWDGGQVAQLLAEELQFPCVTIARSLEWDGEQSVRMVKEISGGLALVEAQLPLVASITNTSSNQLRVAKVKDAMAARKGSVTTWTAEDMGLKMSALLRASRKVEVQRVYFPETHAEARIIDATDVDMAADQVAQFILGLMLPATQAGNERRVAS